MQNRKSELYRDCVFVYQISFKAYAPGAEMRSGAFCILHRLMADILAVKSRMKKFSGQFCRNDKSSCKETGWFLKNFWLDITNFMAIIDFC